MFEIVSRVSNFKISDCIFTNETLSKVYIESINKLDQFYFKHSVIESIQKYSSSDIGVMFINIEELESVDSKSSDIVNIEYFDSEI